MIDTITLTISRDALELLYDALDENVDPTDDEDYVEALNVIEKALGKELTEFEDDEDDLDG